MNRSAVCPETRNSKNSRKKLREANQPKIERLVRDLIDLPSDCNRLHFQAGNDEPASGEKKRESRISESDSPGEWRGPRFGHRTNTLSQNWICTRGRLRSCNHSNRLVLPVRLGLIRFSVGGAS